MPLKCCVTGCVSNYAQLKRPSSECNSRKADETDNLPPNKRRKANSDHIPIFKFPKNDSDKESWIKNIPRDDYKITKWTGVCYRHWPIGFKSKPCQGGGVRPVDPPTIFDMCNIPKSQIPTPVPQPRSTEKSSSSARNPDIDQMPEVLAQLKVEFGDIMNENVPILTYHSDNIIYIQSREFSAGCVPKFLVKVFSDLDYESYHSGVLCPTKTVLKISKLNDWGIIINVINHLNNLKISQKVKVLSEDIDSLSNINVVGKKVYSMDTILRAFEYFATSRATYKRFVQDYQLPSVRLLQHITSQTKTSSDSEFIEKVFKNLTEKQRQCILLVDEIHVKPQLLYHGGQLFGKAVNDPNSLATSVLAVMVYCLFGGPKFIVKLIPVTKLDSQFQFDIVKNILNAIEKSNGETIAIICDDNRVNQKFFKLFPTQSDKPWITCESNMNIPVNVFLLFDYVHLFKSIRNNWYTEKTREITYFHPNMPNSATAKWDHVYQMFQKDSQRPYMKFAHKLTPVAVSPKPIERQNVGHMLKVFCDETVASLRTHPEFDSCEVEPTARYLELWVEAWTILNVNQPHKAIRLRDPRRAEFRNTHDPRLNQLEEMAQMVERMDCNNGKLNLNFQFTLFIISFGN